MNIEEKLQEASIRMQKRIKEIESEYSQKFKEFEKEIKDDSDDIEDTTDGSVGGKFKVDIWWKEETTILHIPQFTYNPKFVIVEVPGVKMERKSFSVPEIKTEWVDVVKGHVPDCDFRKIPPKCKMKPVIISEPRVTTRMRDVFFDFPSIFKEKWKLDMPWIDTKFVETKLIYSIPQIAFRDVEVEVEEKTSELNSKVAKNVSKYESEMKLKIQQVLSEEANSIFDPAEEYLMTEREKVRKEFATGISMLKATIKSMKDQKVPENQVSAVAAQLNDLIEQSKNALKKFDNAIDGLIESKEKFMNGIA